MLSKKSSYGLMTDLGLNIVDCYQNMPKVCSYAIFQIFKHHFLVKFG